MQLHKIIPESYVDGPGKRTVIFFQGCNLACPGCQNQALWPAEGGETADVLDVAGRAAQYAGYTGGNITISGGEPFGQVNALAELVALLKTRYRITHIIVYSGYTWEQINSRTNGKWLICQDALDYIDVLVDGRFVKEQDDPYIVYRGSRNQRPIDVAASRKAGRAVTLNWDNPEAQITPGGDVVLPAGLAGELGDIGRIQTSPMCGQARRKKRYSPPQVVSEFDLETRAGSPLATPTPICYPLPSSEGGGFGCVP